MRLGCISSTVPIMSKKIYEVIWNGPSAEFDSAYSYDGTAAAYPTEVILDCLLMDGMEDGPAFDEVEAARREGRIQILSPYHDDEGVDHYASRG